MYTKDIMRLTEFSWIVLCQFRFKKKENIQLILSHNIFIIKLLKLKKKEMKNSLIQIYSFVLIKKNYNNNIYIYIYIYTVYMYK